MRLFLLPLVFLWIGSCSTSNPAGSDSRVSLGFSGSTHPSETLYQQVLKDIKYWGVAGYHSPLVEEQQGLLFGSGELWDLALDGPGYFQVETKNVQIHYTRNGEFRWDFITQSLRNTHGEALLPSISR
jgi:flagellar hook protein FlgE